MLDGTHLPSPLFTSPHRLKLGVFHMNCTRGATPTLAEGSIETLDWAQQVRIAVAAETAGLDAIIPIARWRGYGLNLEPGVTVFPHHRIGVGVGYLYRAIWFDRTTGVSNRLFYLKPKFRETSSSLVLSGMVIF